MGPREVEGSTDHIRLRLVKWLDGWSELWEHPNSSSATVGKGPEVGIEDLPRDDKICSISKAHVS